MNNPRRTKLANIFGGLGYLATILQWTWALMLVIPPLLRLDSVQKLLLPHHNTHPVHTTPMTLPAFWTISFIILAFVIVILGMFFALKMPIDAARQADKTTRKTARTMAHRVTKHPRNQREIRQLSRRLIWLLKWLAVFLGLLLAVIAAALTSSLDDIVIIVVGIYLMAWSILWFGLQYLIEPRK